MIENSTLACPGNQPNRRPATVGIEQGLIVMEGQGSATTMTPLAARVTGERLIAAAVEVMAAQMAGEAV